MSQRNRILIAMVLVLIAAYITGGKLPALPRPAHQSVATSTPNPDKWYPIVRVSDGDTIVANVDGTEMHVRLLGINSPEVSGPYTKEECYGKEASAAAKQVMNGSSVRLVTDPSQDTFDQYGRLLAYVYVPANVRSEGILVNEYMVAQGFAREYTYKKAYAQQSVFRADESAARAAKRGLWGACPAQ